MTSLHPLFLNEWMNEMVPLLCKVYTSVHHSLVPWDQSVVNPFHSDSTRPSFFGMRKHGESHSSGPHLSSTPTSMRHCSSSLNTCWCAWGTGYGWHLFGTVSGLSSRWTFWCRYTPSLPLKSLVNFESKQARLSCCLFDRCFCCAATSSVLTSSYLECKIVLLL